MFKNRQTLLFVGDVAMLVLAFIIMVAVRFDLSTQASYITKQAHLFAYLFALWLVVFFIFDLYSIRRINPNPTNIGLLVLAILVNVLLSVLILYVSPNIGLTPKTNLLIIALSSFLLLVGWRRLFYNLSTRAFKRLIVLVGNSTLLHDLAQEFKQHPHLGEVVIVQNFSFDRSIIDRPNVLIVSEYADPKVLIDLAKYPGTEVLSLFEAYRTIFAKIPVEFMTDEKAVEMISAQDHTGVRYLYRIIEIILATFVLIVTSPFLLIAMIATWVYDGTPLFIRQKRVGKNGTLFTVYKLRTMKALSADGSAEMNGAQWASHKDDRITPVGAILRTTHLDEVPQMWNIIKGDIALVGPRPERPELVQELETQIPYYFVRHSIKPGFTGWAQIKFRYARTVLDSQEKFEYDLYYLHSRNPLLDLGIVLKTAQIIFTH